MINLEWRELAKRLLIPSKYSELYLEVVDSKIFLVMFPFVVSYRTKNGEEERNGEREGGERK